MQQQPRKRVEPCFHLLQWPHETGGVRSAGRAGALRNLMSYRGRPQGVAAMSPTHLNPAAREFAGRAPQLSPRRQSRRCTGTIARTDSTAPLAAMLSSARHSARVPGAPTLADLLRASPWVHAIDAPLRARVESETITRSCPAGGLVCRKGEQVESWIGVI